ncbi:MAG: uroporphyrinogen decarboxylase family protein [bacterium]
MASFKGFSKAVQPDWPGLVDNIRRRGTPERVYFMELFQDPEIREAIAKRFALTTGLDPRDPDFERKKYIAIQRFCGYDFVRIGMVGLEFPFFNHAVKNTASSSNGARNFRDEHTGPITNWEEFEKFPWPDPRTPSATRELEWYQKNLPEDMCIVGSGGFAHQMEFLSWLMGYETLCYALSEQRELVAAIARKLEDFFSNSLTRILEFDRVKLVWGSDDMGFKTGLLISPPDMRELVLRCHKQLAATSHAAGRPYLLHSCGNLSEIMEELIDAVGIDAKHSFEDTIEDVCDVKRRYGRRLSLIGGIDVDFLCRADEPAIRERVRKTLDVCQPGGGYCLGTGNSVANYIPLDNYMIMLDEGRRYSGG